MSLPSHEDEILLAKCPKKISPMVYVVFGGLDSGITPLS